MAQQSLIITGPLVRLYVNKHVYSVAQSVSLETDTGEYAIYGINSPNPQELAGGGQVSVRGSVKGLRVKNSAGLQGSNLRPLFSDIAASNYVSLRLEDRSTGETLWSIPKAKISKTSDAVQIKGTYKLSFDFIGQIAFFPLDLS
jgi:hypothetical protein